MRRLFLYCFASTFTIIGSIIGAGFITGKEVFEFFAKDFSLSGMYLTFLCFTFTIYFVMQYMSGDKAIKCVEMFVCLSNVVVAGCMVSALDLVYKRLFCVTENIKIFSIITAILLLIIAKKGVWAVEKFCALTLPFVIVIIVVLSLIKIEDYAVVITPNTSSGVVKPFVYVGFNVALSAGIIKNSGEKLSPPFKFIASVATSFIICICIFLLSLAVKNNGKASEMPFVSLFYSNKKLLKIVDIITLFAIYSTLISSLYTVNSFAGLKVKSCYKFALFFAVISISFLGFESIVERVYPTLGILSYAFILITFLLSTPFLKGRRLHTLPLLKHKE